MGYMIDQDRCINCWFCRRECPTETIRYFDQDNRKHWIDPAGCIDCDICARVCPVQCITPQPEERLGPEAMAQGRDRARAFYRERRQLTMDIRAFAEHHVVDAESSES